ncbi:hypothetical protein KFL_003310100 [Klebsormidium nitens]|uniref:Uncharacterized protein n=1 Tax=Klebsormidium nitens TaxID=105231 RepID=A0A1Y1IG61_KLENI|nr:hypothetical protein KFL_003310100 [Klebsormidium nitens]|eukprot:GAQ87098.1 hypothetical protein KFL_003310100 [Klebsormidium nitens]
MAAALGSLAECLQASSSLAYRQSSSQFCSTSWCPTATFLGTPSIGSERNHALLSPVCAAKGPTEVVDDRRRQLFTSHPRRLTRRLSLFANGPARRPTAVRAKGRPKREEEEPLEDETDEPLDMEVVDVGEDPFSERDLDFEEAPVKAAKKSMEEKMAYQAKDDMKKRTEMKEFTDRSGKKVFLEVAIQDRTPEELDAIAWQDRNEFDAEVENPHNWDSQSMDPFKFRAKLPEAVHDNDEFVFERYPDVDDSDDETSNSILRDDSANPHEEWFADDWAGPLTVTELEHTRFMMPSAWEGRLEDGREIYVKHRYGVLNVMVMHQKGWRRKWNTAYYLLHSHHLNSQCTTRRMRELLEGRILNFACEIKFADRFNNVYDVYEGYDVERRMLDGSQGKSHPNWEYRTDFPQQDKVEFLETAKEQYFDKQGQQKHKL